MRRLHAIALLAAAVLAGCGIGPARRDPLTLYDFGPPPAPAQAAGPGPAVGVPRVAAPTWLDSAGIVYRLAYADPQAPRVYAASRWVAEFPELFTARLRQHLAAGRRVVSDAPETRPEQVLRVELEDVAQVFDGPASSRGVLRLRASLYGGGQLRAQRAWSIDEPAPSPDAGGGARALTRASDRAIAEIARWLAAESAAAR